MKDLELKICYTAQNVITKKLIKIIPLKKNKLSYRAELIDEASAFRYEKTLKANGDNFYVVGTSPLQVYEFLEGDKLRKILVETSIASVKRDIEYTKTKIEDNKTELEYIQRHIAVKEQDLKTYEKKLKELEEEWDTLLKKSIS